MKANNSLLLILFFSFQASTQPLKPGDKIPEITISSLINASQPSVDLHSLKGKVVVLDFWATWCVPCIKSLPKLEKMQAKYGSSLQVIAVSNESPERIARFIKNRPVDLWFASDTGTASILRQAFPHTSLPHVVIIDKEGVVRAITSGDELTDETIAQVQKGIQPAVSFKDENVVEGEVFEKVAQGEEHFSIKGFQDGVRSGKTVEPNSITYVNMHFSRFFLDIYHMQSTRLRYENIDAAEQKSTNDSRYSVYIATKDTNYQKLTEALKQKLQQEFVYKTRLSKEKDTVFVLSRIGAPDTSIVKPPNSTVGSGSNKGKFYSRGKSIGQAIADYLEGFGIVDGIVLDETGDIKLHDIVFSWEPEKKGAVDEFLERLGLKMERALREYDVLVIYK